MILTVTLVLVSNSAASAFFSNLTLNCVDFENIHRELRGNFFCCSILGNQTKTCGLLSECVVVSIAEKQTTSAQIKEHRRAVLDLIEVYLKGEFVAHLAAISGSRTSC